MEANKFPYQSITGVDGRVLRRYVVVHGSEQEFEFSLAQEIGKDWVVYFDVFEGGAANVYVTKPKLQEEAALRLIGGLGFNLKNW